MLNTQLSPWPLFSQEEMDAVQDVLRSGAVNYWTGFHGRDFEREFADWVGVKYAIALMNGSVALELALRALGIGSGDEVIVTPRSFLASVSCVINVGANPVFADVDLNSGNITAQTIRPHITTRTKAVICVHLGGYPCDMDPIMALAEDQDLFVIEDCAQSHGAQYKGRSVGSIGHIAAWSFCQDKIMTTGGEGGMVTCNNEVLWRTMWAYKDHGKSYAAVYERDHPSGFRWLHETFGTNWRMTEMQSAIGRIQLSRMPEWGAQRRKNAKRLEEALLHYAGDGGIARVSRQRCTDCLLSSCECQHAYYRYYAYVCIENLPNGWSRDRILSEINSRGIPCFSGSCSEIYLEKAFENTKFRPEQRLPVARNLGDSSIMFLVHPTLTSLDMDKTVDVIHEVFGTVSKAQ